MQPFGFNLHLFIETKIKKITNNAMLVLFKSATCMFYFELVPQEYVGADCITVDLLKDIDEPTDA